MRMSKAMKTLVFVMIVTIVSFFLFFALYQVTDQFVFEVLYITCLTSSYHFIMRCIVGAICEKTSKTANYHYDRGLFKEHSFEKKFFQKIRIRKWRYKLPTAYPEQFDYKKATKDELLRAMSQAEIAHTTMSILSYVPLLFITFFGQPIAFIVTSIVCSFLEVPFILLQRYNRPFLLRVMEREKRIKHGNSQNKT